MAVAMAARFDLKTRVRNNRCVLPRRHLLAALLLIAAAVFPQWLCLGAHVLRHHEHGEDHGADLAQALVHGHSHEEGVPDHEHRLLAAPSLRPDPQQELQAPAIASLEAPAVELLALSDPQRGSAATGSSGSSPPRLHLLCTLLI